MPQLLALVASLAWGIGGYLEKKGLNLANISPQLGLTLRALVSLMILAAVSLPEWKSVSRANTKGLMLIVLGGGLLTGVVGLLCYYAAIKGAPLTRVMPIAFTSPLVGAAMAILFGGEQLSWRTAIGMLMTTGGIALLAMR